MKRVSSRSHPSQSLLGELRALANRSLCADVLVLDARALRVWASASGDGLLMDAVSAPGLREVLEALHVSSNELLEALRTESPSPSIPPPNAPQPEDSAPAASLGPFEVVDVLEDDGTSIVFRARIPGPDAPDGLVLVRRTRASAWRDTPSVQTLLAETQAVAAVSHPNIVQVFDVGLDDDAYWIVTEDFPGVRVSELMGSTSARKTVQPSRLAASVVAQAAAGLHALHELRGPDGQPRGLVYGHVSPAAALVTSSGRIVVLPLGAVAYEGEPERRAPYTAPEQARREPLDRRTDVFALGVLLRELAAGDLEGLEPILDRALRERPEERFQTASELSDALQSFLAQAGAQNVEAPVRAWFEARGRMAIVPDGTDDPVPLDALSPPDPKCGTVRRRALAHLSSHESLESVRRGKPAHVTHSAEDVGYIARSFARLYLLVLVFEGDFLPSRAEAALKRSLPRVQSLMSAIAAEILS